MYKEVLRSIADVQIFPLIGMSIFMTFFMGLIVYVILMKKEKIRELESIPFDTENPS